MTPDQWQLLIGALAVADGLYLAFKARRTQERVIWSAVFPRLFLGAWSLIDASWQRATMEPGRTISYISLVVLLATANLNHVAEWRNRK